MRCVRNWEVKSCFTYVHVVLTVQIANHPFHPGGGGGGGVKEQHKKQTEKNHNLTLKLMLKKLFPFEKYIRYGN